MVRKGEIHGIYSSLSHRLIVNLSAGTGEKRNGFELEKRRLPLRRRAFRRSSRRRGGSPILQLLDLPHDGLPASDRAEVALSPGGRRKVPQDLCLQHRNGETSFLWRLRDQILLRAALASRRLQR